MQANAPQVDVQRASLASIAVGHIGIGPVHIGEVVVQNANLSLSAGLGLLRNVRVTITLRITLSWSIHVPLPWPFDDIDIGDDYDLGSPSFSTTVGDITIPGLNNIQVNLPSLSATNVSVGTVNPLTNLQLSNLIAEQIRARNVVLPTAGFTIAGLTLDSVEAEAVGVPAANIAEATVGRARGDPLRLSEFSSRQPQCPGHLRSRSVEHGAVRRAGQPRGQDVPDGCRRAGAVPDHPTIGALAHRSASTYQRQRQWHGRSDRRSQCDAAVRGAQSHPVADRDRDSRHSNVHGDLMSTEETPEIVDVPVKRFDVSFTLDDLLARVSEQAAGEAQADPEVAENLQRISELARQLKDELAHVNQVKPSVLARLKQRPDRLT